MHSQSNRSLRLSWGSVKNLLVAGAGVLVMAAALNIFIIPNNIAPGGVSGIAIVLNYLYRLPVGTVSLLINVPLLLAGWQCIGRRFTVTTLCSVAFLSVATDFLLAGLPAYQGDPLLAALFGGVLMGVSMGMVFAVGTTMGGTDILTRIVQKKWPYLSMGSAVMGINAAVLAGAALVYQNIETALYGLICLYAASKVMDSLLYGFDVGKSVTIVSGQSRQIAQQINRTLNRGATLVDARGAYTGEPTGVVLCVVRKAEFYKLRRLVFSIDPKAFVIVSEAGEILGQGFKAMDAADGE